ncbi:MAG TPA: outer membrane beta-barrel protein [Candidatus Elarobacter sp.]|nr:outer membrane beta-barrel protein [Candidatus Elarobacter sp.]
MIPFSKLAAIATITITSAATAVSAGAQQRNPVELGIDARVATTVGSSPNLTTVAIPAASFRVGFFVNPRISVEPRLGVVSTSGGGSTFTVYTGSVGMLYHFSKNQPVGTGVYARPFIGITGTSGGGTSDHEANIGVGLGVKIPFASRLATRLEANYAHSFKSGSVPSMNQIGADIGLSFFTR